MVRPPVALEVRPFPLTFNAYSRYFPCPPALSGGLAVRSNAIPGAFLGKSPLF